MVHKKHYIDKVKHYSSSLGENPSCIEETWPTYMSDHAYLSSTCAVGSTLNLIDAVLSNKVCVLIWVDFHDLRNPRNSQKFCK